MRGRIAPELVRRGRRLIASIFRPDTEREVDEEMDFHLAMRVREYTAEGMDEEEARQRALAGFGDMGELRARCARLADEREGRMRRSAWYDGVRQDLVFALRQMVGNPGFTAVAVLTLTLAIGTNAAVFSVVHGVLLKPLPYDEPEELVSLWTRYLPSTGLDIPRFPISPPEILEYRDASDAMESVAAYYVGRSNLGGGGGEPLSVRVLYAGRDLLPLLGVEPALGRAFSEEEERPGAALTVLLGHDFWLSRFGGDPEVIGRAVDLDGESARIVGVLPDGVNFPNASVEVWRPLGLDEQNPGGRGAHWLLGVGRLADGVDLSGAEAELESITASWNEQWEHHASGHFIFLTPLRDDLVGDVRPTLLALFGAVGLVLLVACGNVANLFLVRTESRSREMAIRTALGAGRSRLVRQLLTEAGVITLMGGTLGVALAAWATPALLAVDPSAVPRSAEVSLSLPVLAFTAGLVLLTTLGFGAVPALRAGRGDGPAADLAGGRDGAGRPRPNGRRALVAAEVALSLMVLIGAGLVARSFLNLRAVDAGIVEEGLLTFGLEVDEPEPAAVRAFYGLLQDRLAALPGVESASAVSALPGTGEDFRSDFLPEGEPPPAAGVPGWNAQLRIVRPDFFETVGIPVVRGRSLAASDDESSSLAAVVDEATVARYWPGEDPVGRRITFSLGDPPEGSERPWLTIVGVVGDVLDDLDGDPLPHVYLPHAQLGAASLGTGRNMTMVVRSGGDPVRLFPAVRRTVREMDATLPLSRLSTMASTLDTAVAKERMSAGLFVVFGLSALLLAVVGVYGVVSYTVARRTREMGVRMALGAGRGRVMATMVAEGAVPAAVGALGGLVLAVAAAPLVADLLFEVSPRDPGIFVGGMVLLLSVAVTAAALPARRATRIEPARALRED